MHPDYKEEIAEQYPECLETAQYRHGANWFRVTFHLPALAEKDRQITDLKDEVNRLTYDLFHERANAQQMEYGIASLKAELEEARELLNKPEILNFIEGVKIEAAHQTERWGIENENSYPPHHYILVLSKLLGKLSVAIWDKNVEKFAHHLITISASCGNCHRQIADPKTFINEYFTKTHKDETTRD